MFIRTILLLCYFIVNVAVADDNIPWSKLKLRNLSVDAQIVSFTPDSKYLLFAKDGEILFYSMRTGKFERTERIKPGNSHSTNFLAISKAGSMMATTSITPSGETILLWNFPDATLASSWPTTADVLVASFSTDGRLLVTGDLGGAKSEKPGIATIWDINSGHKIHTLTMQSSLITSVSFNPDTTLLATSSDNKVDIWSVNDWRKLQILKGDSAIFSPDGQFLACTVRENEKSGINLWDIEKKAWLWPNPTHGFTASIRGIGFTPDSKYVASVGKETIVSSTVTRKQVYKFPVSATTLAFSNDGRWFVLINATEMETQDVHSNVYIYSATDGSAVFKSQ